MTYSRFRQLILIIGLSYCGQMMAQESVISLVKKVGTMLDSMAVKGLDQRYIEAPKKPWQIIARGNVYQTIVSMETHGDIIEMGHKYSANPYFRTQPSQNWTLRATWALEASSSIIVILSFVIQNSF